MRHRLPPILILLCFCRAAHAGGPTTSPAEMVFIKGGTFAMGTGDGFPYEHPVHNVTVKSFWIDKTEVTVAEFEKFFTATNYKTDAEKWGWSGVFDPKAH